MADTATAPDIESHLGSLMDSCRELIDAGNPAAGLERAIEAKALRVRREGLDLLRAAAFLGLGRRDEAREALREELRWHPGQSEAARLLESLGEDPAVRSRGLGDAEFQGILAKIRPFSMLSEERLLSLFEAARRICRDDLPGNFVECGVAAGGSSGLMSWVVSHHSRRPRKVFSLDTFEGMPPPTEEDRHGGTAADATGWGTSTCAAPVESLAALCRKLGTEGLVVPVQGLFQDTLPVRKSEFGEIALLHMDGDWYDSTMAILVNIYDQVSPGGFVQVDDYGHWDGCRKAIHEFEGSRKLSWSLERIDSTGVRFLKGTRETLVLPGAGATQRTRSQADPATLLRRGLDEMRRREPDRALSTATEALSMDVPQPGLHMLRAAALLHLGRDDEGVAALRREIELFPGNEDAREALAELLPAKVPSPSPTGSAKVVVVAAGPVAVDAGSKVYLNLGCGRRFHPSWTNYDVFPGDASVKKFDARARLEHADGSVDAVYHSHLLEHLGRDEARTFLRECLRVLVPGGVLRVAVPDLEGICRQYLSELEAAVRGDAESAVRRDWMVVELLDQVARHRSGGEMLRWWSRSPVSQEAFVVGRVGQEAAETIEQLRRNPVQISPDPIDPAAVGSFRLSGEAHRWMYDRVSLAELLLEAGFRHAHVVGATESALPGFASYRLDTADDGTVRKPDSLFMEAFRP